MVEGDISAAFDDCKSRRTYVLKHRLRPSLVTLPHPAGIRA
jgi:hypothetical protein